MGPSVNRPPILPLVTMLPDQYPMDPRLVIEVGSATILPCGPLGDLLGAIDSRESTAGTPKRNGIQKVSGHRGLKRQLPGANRKSGADWELLHFTVANREGPQHHRRLLPTLGQ